MFIDVNNDRNLQRLRVAFRLVAIALGILHAWGIRHTMYTDGISYLDMGDAYLRGDWDMAINGYWSPFYSWLLGLAMLVLKPSPYWEFSVVHLVNFAIYLCALSSFDFFLRELLRYHRRQTSRFSGDERVFLPEWAWLALGYTVFIWSSLNLITIWVVTPDMCLAAFVYLASGIILRIRMGCASWLTFVFLGVVLGFGYLTKAAMFPLSFIFLGVSVFSVGNLRSAVPRVLIALVVFLLVASPFIVALSEAKGRLTFGDSGKLAYAWVVNNCVRPSPWQGDTGILRHPPRKIFDAPAIYEFGTPIECTYSLWYDPSYWGEGAVSHFDLGAQISAIASNAKRYYHIFSSIKVNAIGLIVGFLILFFYMTGRRWWWLCVKDIAKHWCLLIPAIAPFVMYSLVIVMSRYIGAFATLLWAGAFSGLRFHDTQGSRRLVACVTISILTVMWITIGGTTAQEARSTAYDLIKGLDSSNPHVHWQVADGLKRMEIQQGDKVVSIGSGWPDYYWARLARLRVIAEIDPRELDSFWTVEPLMVRPQLINALTKTGAKAIVVEKLPKYVSSVGWQRIENTDYYAYILPKIGKRKSIERHR